MTVPLPDSRPQAERIAEHFGGAEGQDHYLVLLHYTERLVRSMHWCIATNDSSMPGGVQARDILHATVQSLLLDNPNAPGYRQLPAKVGVEPGLKMIIWSKINHAAEDTENVRRKDHKDIDREGNVIDHLETDAPMWDPGQEKLSTQQQAHVAARCTRFIEYCRKDKVVCDLLILIRDTGVDRPAERLAKELRIRVGEVYLARKRLGTLLRQFRKTATS
ncbi:MAG: hypothetical protein JSS11_06880 [Verrucomicrobia bacterium]|nr:hypothetical protein [Verrucomicrobiota bacterium]